MSSLAFVPRYYQEEAVIGLFNYFASHPVGNPIVALPTGTGKSAVIADFIYRSLNYYPQTRFMVATHVKELVAQNHAELIDMWPTAPAGIYSAGLGRRESHLPITFCGIASVAKRISDFGKIDLLVVDECHLISDKGESLYAKSIGELMAVNPYLKVIGLTATPYRQGMGLLTQGKIFTDISTDYCQLDKFNELIDRGYLSPLIPKRTTTELDTEDVGISHGEFNIDELQAAVDIPAVTARALDEACVLARDRQHWLVFCAGIDHVMHVCSGLNERGVTAIPVHSELTECWPIAQPMQKGETPRDAHIRCFREGKVRAMVGVGIFTTGFNYRPVDCIICLRPTMSPVLWVQMLGRGTRPSPETGKQNCLVLDFAANTRRLGPINDPVLPRKKGKKGSPFVPYKVCPHCQTYNHTRARFCMCCQAEFPPHLAIDTTAANEELIRRGKKPEALSAPAPEVVQVVETYNVNRVEWMRHRSKDINKPPSLLVTFYCQGGRIFNEWLCLEHPQGFARKKGRDSWRQMAQAAAPDEDPGDPPETIEDALELTPSLRPPSAVRVLMKDKWPEVVGYEFGSHEPANGEPPADDIPF